MNNCMWSTRSQDLNVFINDVDTRSRVPCSVCRISSETKGPIGAKPSFWRRGIAASAPNRALRVQLLLSCSWYVQLLQLLLRLPQSLATLVTESLLPSLPEIAANIKVKTCNANSAIVAAQRKSASPSENIDLQGACHIRALIRLAGWCGAPLPTLCAAYCKLDMHQAD